MAELVVGLLASALVGIAKDKLSSAITEQGNLLWNFGGDLKDMESRLKTISAALQDAEERSVKEKTVQLLLKRLKDTALDISDILEDYQDSSDEATTKMPCVPLCLPMANKKMSIGKRMKTVRENLRNIHEEFQDFTFIITQGNRDTNEHHPDVRETTSSLSEEPIIGRDAEKQEIINLLLTGSNNNGIVIVPICGLGGMGKSTLAQLVYNDDQFKKFNHHIWVYVSQDFNLFKIGRSIITQLLQPNGGRPNLDTQQDIKNCLFDRLPGKKILVVLDDLWEEEKTHLDNLGSILHVKDSMIYVIVTTRNEEIARKFSTSEPYNLKGLTDDQCWEIIRRSSMFEQKSNKEKLKEVGLDIARKCGGVALAAQAIGFMLQSIDDLFEWKKINSNDIWNECSKDNRVLPSLMLSYERMTPQLRACFSYCAIFPKGHNIIEDDLVHQWIAMDFIKGPEAKQYIKKLLGMSFLQASKSPVASKGHAVGYTMHDLVHDLATLIMGDDLIICDVGTKTNACAQEYCRYSLLRKYNGTTKLSNILPSKTRVLRFSDSSKLDIPIGALSFAKYLRTLDFSECSGIMLPPSIGELKRLRCLIAPRLQNESLPECITKLSKLQYLSLHRSSHISTLPESIGKLGCLQYLGMSGCSGISKLPESSGNLKCMVHLDMSGCSGITELPRSLGNLTNLQHLELSECSSLQEIPESLCAITQLQYLDISFCAGLHRLPDAIGSLVDLQYLDMSWCEKMEKLPESMTNLQNLLHLDLSRCGGVEEWISLGGLRGLTALQHLDLERTGIPRGEADGLGNLTNLKYLRLSKCNMYAIDFIGTLTNLEHLDLSWNRKLACIPESIGNLKRLQTLDLTCCDGIQSVSDSIGALLGLKSLILDLCYDKVKDQFISRVHYSKTLPEFKVLANDVNGCRKLHLLEGAPHVSELRILGLENARSLEAAGRAKLVDKHNLSKLTLEWTPHEDRHFEDSELLGQLVPPRALKHMCLEGYSSKGFPGWLMDISGHVTDLVTIELSDLPKCSNLPPLGQLPHLKELRLYVLPSIKNIGMEFCGDKKGAFRRLSDFIIGTMEGLEEWNTTYSVEDGVEEFMFPVLHRLSIWDCPRLRLKPCPPTFGVCDISSSDQVASSLEELQKMNHHPSASRGTNLELSEMHCQSMDIFHHFPGLTDLTIQSCDNLTSLPESMRHLTSLETLTLGPCGGISALPEWLGDLSSLKGLYICGCEGIKTLPPCMQQLTRLEVLKVWRNPALKVWCESEENKTKLAHIKVQAYIDD